MAKYRLNDCYGDTKADAIGSILEAEGGYIERKENGDIWTERVSEKGLAEMSTIETIVVEQYKRHYGRKPQFYFFAQD